MGGDEKDLSEEQREMVAVEKLSTADGLAGWVLLKEDGGAGVGGGGEEEEEGAEEEEWRRDPMEVDGEENGGGDGKGKRRRAKTPIVSTGVVVFAGCLVLTNVFF